MRLAILLLAFLTLTDTAYAQRRSRRACYNCQPVQWQVVPSQVIPRSQPLPKPQEVQPATPKQANPIGSDDALDEVNAKRAARGLPPFKRDGLLTRAAQIVARKRAERLIAGHLPEGDLGYVPEGGSAAAAGCAAWEPEWGWGSCCTYDNYAYAGAAWVMGQDGRRFMSIFVR